MTEDPAKLFKLVLHNAQSERQFFFAFVLGRDVIDTRSESYQMCIDCVVGGEAMIRWMMVDFPSRRRIVQRMWERYVEEIDPSISSSSAPSSTSAFGDFFSQYNGDSELWDESAKGRRHIRCRMFTMCFLLMIGLSLSFVVFMGPTLWQPRALRSSFDSCFSDTAAEWPQDLEIFSESTAETTKISATGSLPNGIPLPKSCQHLIAYVLPVLADVEPKSLHADSASLGNSTGTESNNSYSLQDIPTKADGADQDYALSFGLHWLFPEALDDDIDLELLQPRMPRYLLKFELEKASNSAVLSNEAVITLFQDGCYTLWMNDIPSELAFLLEGGAGAQALVSAADVRQWTDSASDALSYVIDARWKLTGVVIAIFVGPGSVLLFLLLHVLMVGLYMAYFSGCCCSSPPSWGFVRVIVASIMCLSLLMNFYSCMFLLSVVAFQDGHWPSVFLIASFGLYNYFVSSTMPTLINFIFCLLYMNVCMYGDAIVEYFTTGGNGD